MAMPMPTSLEAVNLPGSLLVRGLYVKAPTKCLEELGLPERVFEALAVMRINDLSDLQKIVIPNLANGTPAFVIAPDGKQTSAGIGARALCYLLPIIGKIYDTYETIRELGGDFTPDALIICDSYGTGNKVETTLASLLSFSKHVPLQVEFLSLNHPNSRIRVPTGKGIVIMTMNYLNELVKTGYASRLLSGLRFIIFEEFEQYAEKHWDDIVDFIQIARQNLAVIPNAELFQLAICGSKWTDRVEELYNMFAAVDQSPLLAISAFNQIIRYSNSNITWLVHEVNFESYIGKLISLVKSAKEIHSHIVIACSNPTSADHVHTALSGNAIRNQVANSALSVVEINELINFWGISEEAVVVVSDNMIHDLQAQISNATCLIWFDSPQLVVVNGVKKSVAADRFGYIWSNIRNIHMEVKHPELTQDKSMNELVVHFLMTGEEPNFQAMYKFLSSLGENISFPPRLRALAEKLEREGINCPELCENMRLFGICSKIESQKCLARHNFSQQELTEEPDAPYTGEVELRIIMCKSPSQFRAQMLRHFIFVDGKRACKTSFTEELSRRTEKLAMHYSNKSNRHQFKEYKNGTLCVVRDPETQNFCRAEFNKILTSDTMGYPNSIQIFCIDTGVTLNPSTDDVFGLAEMFQGWGRLVVDVILTSVKPLQNESEYRPTHKAKACKLTKDKIYNAKIWLSVGNTVWVNPMVELLEYWKNLNTGKIERGISVRQELITRGIATSNSPHLKYLIDSVKRGGLYPGLDSLTHPSVDHARETDDDTGANLIQKLFYQLGDDYRWAHVDLSTRAELKPTRILAQYGVDPWTFYGVHSQFDSVVHSLEKELNSTIIELIQEQFSNYDELFKDYYQPQMAVAVKERNHNEWKRAIILSKQEKEGGLCFEVFYVDDGDFGDDMTLEEMFLLPVKFVNQLPFQVIAFKLDHVKPCDERRDWDRSETEAFLDLVVPGSISVQLQLLAMGSVDDLSELPVPCRYYKTVAFSRGEELGELLVRQSKAVFKEGGQRLVQELENTLRNPPQDVNLGDVDIYFGDEDVNSFFRNVFSESSELKRNEIKKFELPIIEERDNSPNRSVFRIGSNQDENRPGPSGANLTNSMPPNPSRPPFQTSQASTSSTPPATLHPKIFWRQTDNDIILCVQLPDIREYSVELLKDMQTVCFESKKPANYGFNIRLFGKVLDVQKYLTGQYLKITFTKRMSGVKWVRILHDKKEKYWWLKEDINFLDESDSEDEEKNASRIMENRNDEENDADDESDDEVSASKSYGQLPLGYD